MIGVDTNILVYAERIGEVGKQEHADRILRAIPRRDLVVATQALAELFRVLRRKTTLSASDVRPRVENWAAMATMAPTAETTIETALALAADHDLQIFDAIILAASSETACRRLLSEDMQDDLADAE